MEVQVKQCPLSTDEAASKFLAYIKNTFAPGTLKNYTKALRLLRPMLPAQYAEIETYHLEDWKDAELNKPYRVYLKGVRANDSEETQKEKRQANVYILCTAIKSWCNWITERYRLDDHQNPGLRFKYPTKGKPKYHQRFLDDAEYQKVIVAAAHVWQRRPDDNQLAQDAILWITHTGLRMMEFTEMQWEHFAPDMQSFRVWGKGANGKGHKERVVPCDNAICQAIIAKYKGKAEDIPFVSRFNIFPKQLQRLCEKIARKAGIRRFGPHALRHYYVTTMIAAGVPVKVVSMIIGHANTAITEQVYTHLKQTHIMGWSHMLNDVDKKVTIAPNTMK